MVLDNVLVVFNTLQKLINVNIVDFTTVCRFRRLIIKVDFFTNL